MGLGSFIQGDANAGGWILGGQIAGAVLLGLGSSGAPASIQPIFALSGSLVYLGTTIYGLVAPMQYRDRYNAALKQSLQLNSHSQAQQPDRVLTRLVNLKFHRLFLRSCLSMLWCTAII